LEWIEWRTVGRLPALKYPPIVIKTLGRRFEQAAKTETGSPPEKKGKIDHPKHIIRPLSSPHYPSLE
jgi:hypothetical protein